MKFYKWKKNFYSILVSIMLLFGMIGVLMQEYPSAMVLYLLAVYFQNELNYYKLEERLEERLG